MNANDVFDVVPSLRLQIKQEVCFMVPFHKKYIIRKTWNSIFTAMQVQCKYCTTNTLKFF